MNFDEWAALYKENPVEFERRRVEEIEKVINSVPQHRQANLRRLQWKIDGIRQKYKPLAATIEITKLMSQSLCDLQREWGMAATLIHKQTKKSVISDILNFFKGR